MIKKIFFFLALVFCFSCEEQGWLVKCPDCTAEEPLEAILEIKLDSKFKSTIILINVYEGNIEDSVLFRSFETGRDYTDITVPLNKKYTVSSTYNSTDTYYIAVDSATPRVKYDKYQCDDPCYFVYDRIIDLRLKYTK